MTEAQRLVKEMTNEDKIYLTNKVVIANLKHLAEKSDYLRSGAELAISCIESNKVNVFDFAGMGLTVEIYKDYKAFFMWSMFLITHCEMQFGVA